MSELQTIADDLRVELAASRVTVRLDPSLNLPIVAEALAPGVLSLVAERSIDQMKAETVKWVVEHRRVLAVADAVNGVPRTPRPMVERHGLRAFMIAPIFVRDRFVGSVSVHVNDGPRLWNAADEARAAEAAARVAASDEGKACSG
jgi:maleate isomerase